jgi:hypothetical protein
MAQEKLWKTLVSGSSIPLSDGHIVTADMVQKLLQQLKKIEFRPNLAKDIHLLTYPNGPTAGVLRIKVTLKLEQNLKVDHVGETQTGLPKYQYALIEDVFKEILKTITDAQSASRDGTAREKAKPKRARVQPSLIPRGH